MSVAWTLEPGAGVSRPHLSLISDADLSSGVALGATRRNRCLALALAVVVLVALVLLALPIRSIGGSTLAQAAPTPGQEYLVKQGDSLSSIAQKADPAHAVRLAERLATETGTPVAVPGEHLFIP